MRSCSGCHGPSGRGTKRPGFATPPKDLTDPELQARLSDDEIARTIREGKGPMPPFERLLGEEDIQDIVLFVRTLGQGSSRRR